MKNTSIISLLILTLLVACTSTSDSTEAQGTITETEQAPISEEEQAINQAVLDAYASITFEEGTTPDFAVIRSIFTSTATFGNFVNDSLAYEDMDEFLVGFQAAIGSIKAFDEVELSGKTEYFGKIAHRISAYASYVDGNEEPVQRGVNSFQLFKIDGKWLVNSIIWDIEKEGQPIPEKYLME